MSDTVHFSATEARQNFFTLLRLAQAGKIIEIEKKDENVRFELQKKVQKEPKKDLIKFAKEMGKIGLKAPSDPQELKRILEETHAIELE